MNQDLQKLNLADDFLFAKVMSDPVICKKVLEKILRIKIERIEFPQGEKNVNLTFQGKGIRLDIYVKDDKGSIYNTEMQNGGKRNLPKRSRYYQGNIDLELIDKGETYENLKKSFVIFICTYDPFEKGRHIYTFENQCLEDACIFLGDETTKVFLNTKGTVDDVDEDMKQFLRYVEESSADRAAISGNFVKEIHKKVVKVKNNKEMEVEFMTLLERDREKKEEGIAIGKAEAILELLSEYGDIPIALQEKVMSERDLERLRQWHKTAAKIKNVEEFISAIG